MLFSDQLVVEPFVLEESGAVPGVLSIDLPVEPVELVGFSPTELVVPSVVAALVPAVVSVLWSSPDVLWSFPQAAVIASMQPATRMLIVFLFILIFCLS
jgi:hypothetical protein